MSNTTPVNTDSPIWARTSVSLDEARQMIADHGHLHSTMDLGSDGVALYVHRSDDINPRTGTTAEHVQDTDNGRILTMHLRHALGY